MHTFRFLVGYLFFFFSAIAVANNPDSIRHIQLEQVSIIQNRFNNFQEGLKVVHFDSAQLNMFNSSDLGNLIASTSTIKIKKYGTNGAISTLAMRGGSASQSAVIWNGFPLNSLTTAEADLSLVPLQSGQEIRLIKGAAGSIYGSGTFGGALVIDNLPNFNNRYNISLGGEIGSFGTQNYLADVKVGSSKFQSHTYYYQRLATNDFEFVDADKMGHPLVSMSHNELVLKGFMQNMYLQTGKSSLLEAGLWIQSKSKNLPAISGSYKQSNAHQQDSTLKVFVGWSKRFTSSLFQIKSAWFNDYLRYSDKLKPTDSLYFINSKIQTSAYFTDASYKYYLDKLLFEAGVSYLNVSADVDAYPDNVMENNLSAYLVSKIKRNNFTLNLSAKHEFNQQYLTKPILSASIQQLLFNEKIILRGNASTRYRKPTLNEKYWQPGGNPTISAEWGIGYELGFDGNVFSSEREKFSTGIEVYSYKVNDFIQWITIGNLSYPRNQKVVWSRGLEVEASYLKKLESQVTISAKIDYSFTKSTIEKIYKDNGGGVGNQLRYIPQHTFSSSLYLYWKGFNLMYLFNINGKAPLNESQNSDYMPSYMLSTFQLGFKLPKSHVGSNLSFRVENLFNANYQIMRSYPMPGRAYFIAFSMSILKKSS